MSPLPVRRYRAERLLRKEFDALRAQVISTVRARLRAGGVALDRSDLESCYALAWQGLYAQVLDGQDIANPAGWLVLVTYRRAVDEHRARARAQHAGERSHDRIASGHAGADIAIEEAALERDLAAELDDRAQLRQLFEGLRGRLSAREREAAVLCYLQGLTRAQAAARMGVSEARMRKLMEGAGPARPGVAGKMGALVGTIRDGQWCQEQGSLMRAFAYGVLDRDGERYKLALAHRGECPACRAYVLSLRGLAAALPPVFLPWGLGAAALAGEGLRTGGASAGAGTGAKALSSSGTPAAGAAGAAGAGAAGGGAGGGWLLAAGGKLAAGCALALSVGAGCVAFVVAPAHSHAPAHRRAAAHAAGVSETARLTPFAHAYRAGAASPRAQPASAPPAAPLDSAARASREFGPEQALDADAQQSEQTAQAITARAASAASGQQTRQPAPADTPAQPAVAAPSQAQGTGGASAAEREFSPG